MTWLLILVGGALGAPARYALDRAVSRFAKGAVPWGTIAVNVVGSLALGALARVDAGTGSRALLAAGIGVGFCGGFTTFSTFTWETLALFEDGLPRAAVLNVAVSLTLGLGAAALGWALA